MRDFAEKFLRARDGGLTPQESFRAKKRPDRSQSATFGFVRPLEFVEEEDWYEVLIAAAALPYRHAWIEFRYITTDGDEACRMFFNVLSRFLKRWQDANVLGSFGGSLQSPTQGNYFIGLFPMSLYPPEQFISRDKVAQILTSSGYERHRLSNPKIN